MSERTKKFKKRAIRLVVLSWVLCFGMAIGLLTVATDRYIGREEATIIEMSGTLGDSAQAYVERGKNLIVTSFMSLIPMAVLSIIVKDKIRPLVWMVNIVLANLLLGSAFMYLVFAVWLIDEYVLRWIAKSARDKWIINKEIDLRGAA